ncbi:MAG: phosphoribosylformylglycinamidine synthase subunit PurQ [Pseudomonadota bacterium]
MKTAVLVFPGSNCDRDLAVALHRATGRAPAMVWHKDVDLPAGTDLVAIPGGFSFGDHLRCGAIAAQAPIMASVKNFAAAGGHVLGICNGFQILIESGLLPGTLMRNAGIRFVCRPVGLSVATTESIYTRSYHNGEAIHFPVAHHDGNYFASAEIQRQLADQDRIAFRYIDNPNGSLGNIAGILSQNRRVLGMMPHPERANDPELGGTDGTRLFDALADALVSS